MSSLYELINNSDINKPVTIIGSAVELSGMLECGYLRLIDANEDTYKIMGEYVEKLWLDSLCEGFDDFVGDKLPW